MSPLVDDNTNRLAFAAAPGGRGMWGRLSAGFLRIRNGFADAGARLGAALRGFPRRLFLGYRRQVVDHAKVRELAPADIPSIILHYALLGANHRLSRFGSRMKFAALTRRYATVDWDHSRFLGIYSGRKLVALAEVVDDLFEGAPAKEVALSVLPPWQGTGVGRRLMEVALQRISTDARLPVIIYTQLTNRPMVLLATKFGGTPQVLNGEQAYVILPAAPASAGAAAEAAA